MLWRLGSSPRMMIIHSHPGMVIRYVKVFVQDTLIYVISVEIDRYDKIARPKDTARNTPE